jgi:Tfp pilus assembly protein PilF/biopolymer transport protein ExbD
MFDKIIKTSIYLLVFLLPLFFLPFSFEAFEFNKQYLLLFLVSLAFFSWLARMVLVDKELKFKRTPLDIPILVFLFVAILSAVFSIDKTSSMFGFYGRFSDSLSGLISLVMLYFLITNNVTVSKTPKESKLPTGQANSEIQNSSLIKIFLWSVFFVILFAYLSIFGVWAKFNALLPENFSLPTIMLQRTFNPAAGSMEALAVFLAIITVFLMGRILTGLKGRLSGIIHYLLLIISLFLLTIVDFGPAWILLFASLFIFVGVVLVRRIFKENVNRLLLPILVIILSAVFLFINTTPIQSAILKVQLPQEQVVTQGISWQTAFKGTTENVKSIFLGSGPGTYHYEFSKFKPIEFNQDRLWQIRFDRPASHIAEVLGTMGFLGFLAYFALIGFFLMMGYFFLQQSKAGIPLFMVFLALLVGQFVYYQNTILAFTFWLILALSVVAWQKPVKEKMISFKDFPELSLVFSALLIVIGLGILGCYFFAGKFYLADFSYQSAAGSERIKKLEKTVNLNPYQPQYKIVLSRAYLDKVATETQKPADQRDQAALSNYVHRAITYTKGGEINRKEIEGAVQLAPNRVAAWETLGMVYRDIRGIATGALEWGIKSFGEAVALEPANPVLHTELGKLYLIQGDNGKAKEEFNKAKALKSDYVDASIQLALIYEKEGNLEEAIKQMEGLANVYPFTTEVLFQLGRLYFNNNQVQEAISQFETVVSLMPNHSNAHYSLGVAYQKQGQTQKAIEEFERVLELNPNNPDVQEKLEQLR